MIPSDLMAAWEATNNGLDALLQTYAARIKDLAAALVAWANENRSASGLLVAEVSIETVQALLGRAGLQSYAEGLGPLLTKAGEQAGQLLKATGIPLGVSPVAFRTALQNELTVGVGAVATETIRNLTSLLRESTLIPKSTKQMAQEIEAQTGRLKGRSVALVETSLARMQRLVQTDAAKAIPEAERVFVYTGPKDDRNRPFCARRVGKAYTAKQIGAMQNGQGIPVLEGGGGNRCRHSWVPATRSYITRNNIPLGT